jgi:hypothetical protein
MKKAEEAIKDLPMIPLIINQRAYVGYSVSDLKKVFKSYISSTSQNPPKKNSLNVEIKTIRTLTKATKQTNVSNPITEKKSFLKTITSLFKKEKVHS